MYFDKFEECFERCKIFTAEIEKICAESTNYGEAYRELTSKTVGLMSDLARFAKERPEHKEAIISLIGKTATFSMCKIGKLQTKEKASSR